MLAGTFNALTEAIARFQGEAALRERLSALGRLSTVIAHEVRNPLMIIKTSLALLRRDALSPAEVREVAADVDQQVARLNRIVEGVLDLHGVKKTIQTPIKLTYKPEPGNVNISTSFMVKLSDYEIPRPQMLFMKLSEDQKVSATLVAAKS